MIGVGVGLFFAGYTLLAYGWSQIHGANVSLVEMAWPGAYDGNLNLDGASLDNAPNKAPAGVGTSSGPNASGPGVRPGAKVPT